MQVLNNRILNSAKSHIGYGIAPGKKSPNGSHKGCEIFPVFPGRIRKRIAYNYRTGPIAADHQQPDKNQRPKQGKNRMVHPMIGLVTNLPKIPPVGTAPREKIPFKLPVVRNTG
jgi:hypothetical protein